MKPFREAILSNLRPTSRRRLMTELDNLRAALEWTAGNGEAEKVAEAS